MVRPRKLSHALLVAGLVGFAPSLANAADDAPSAASGTATKGEKLVAQAGVAGGGGGGSEAIKDDSASGKNEKEILEEKKNPWAGSIVLFDQSATTNSFKKDAQLSYSPLYEWWISPRVYYTVKEHFKFGARFDLFKEWTNHEETTYAHEWRAGDPWLTASYGSQASFINKHEKSRFSLGLLFRPPLSKESRGAGQYFSAGPTGAVSVGFDVRGKSAKTFQSASIGVYASYSHAFTRCQTACGFGYDGRSATDTNDHVILNDQVRSSTIAGNSLIYALNGEIDILENLSYGVSMFWIDQFAYAPAAATIGGTTIPAGPNDSHFRQLTWFLTSIDYDPIKELGLSLGYYNLNSAIGPDGTRRNVLWSPDARVFFSLTAHLDAIYEDVAKPRRSAAETASSNFTLFH